MLSSPSLKCGGNLSFLTQWGVGRINEVMFGKHSDTEEMSALEIQKMTRCDPSNKQYSNSMGKRKTKDCVLGDMV